MSNSPSPQSVNSGYGSAVFPQKLTLPVSIEIEVPDLETLSYLQNPDGTMQIGFIADLQDILLGQTNLDILSINGCTKEDIQRNFSKFIP